MNRKIIKNALIMATMVLFVPMAAAQVTIGSVTEPRATLDVVNITTAGHELPQGILPPQVTRAQLYNRADNYDATVNGVIVYVITLDGEADGITRNVTALGHYYFNYNAVGGPAWVRLGGGAVAGVQRHHRNSNVTFAPDMTFFAGSDVIVIIAYGTGGSQGMDLPDLTDIPFRGNIIVYNARSATGNHPVRGRGLNVTANDGVSVQGSVTGTTWNVGQNWGTEFTWVGTHWIAVGR